MTSNPFVFPNKQRSDLEDSGNVWVGISTGLAVCEGVWALRVPHAEGGAGTAAVLQGSSMGLTSVGFNLIWLH